MPIGASQQLATIIAITVTNTVEISLQSHWRCTDAGSGFHSVLIRASDGGAKESRNSSFGAKAGFPRENMVLWRQPTGTTVGKRPHFKPRKIHRVDVLARLRRLRIAPSRTSPISTIRGRDCAFAQFAAHNHPTRRDFISAEQAGTFHQRIYPAVTDPGIKPISSMGHGWRPDPPCLRPISCRMTIFACWPI